MDGKLGPLDVDVPIGGKTNQSLITRREENSDLLIYWQKLAILHLQESYLSSSTFLLECHLDATML
jgi:hypothetical protein